MFTFTLDCCTIFRSGERLRSIMDRIITVFEAKQIYPQAIIEVMWTRMSALLMIFIHFIRSLILSYRVSTSLHVILFIDSWPPFFGPLFFVWCICSWTYLSFWIRKWSHFLISAFSFFPFQKFFPFQTTTATTFARSTWPTYALRLVVFFNINFDFFRLRLGTWYVFRMGIFPFFSLHFLTTLRPDLIDIGWQIVEVVIPIHQFISLFVARMDGFERFGLGLDLGLVVIPVLSVYHCLLLHRWRASSAVTRSSRRAVRRWRSRSSPTPPTFPRGWRVGGSSSLAFYPGIPPYPFFSFPSFVTFLETGYMHVNTWYKWGSKIYMQFVQFVV